MWFDFSAAQGGGPIQAIMRERGVEFKEALHIAAEMAGTQKTPIYSPISSYVKPKEYSEKQELKNKIKSVLSIANGTQPLPGTLGETYLKEHRKIDNPCRLNVKFWPKGARWLDINDEGNLYERVNKIPAIVIAAQNAKQEITGVQRIYLDEKSAGKNTFMGNAKLSKGHMKGSAGVIQIGIKNGEVYIAEGPETAASIAMARPKATVLTSCGIANIQNLGKLIKAFEPNRVIIAGDNDGDSKTLDTTKMAALSLKKEGIKSEIVLPKKIEGLDKTDWNDVLKTEGVKSVSNQLNFDKLNNNKEPLVSENEISKYLISEKILLKENYDLQKKHGYNIGNILENNLHIKEQIDISNKNIMDIYNKSVKDISNKNETYLNKKDIDLEL